MEEIPEYFDGKEAELLEKLWLAKCCAEYALHMVNSATVERRSLSSLCENFQGDPARLRKFEETLARMRVDPAGHYFGRDENGLVKAPGDLPRELRERLPYSEYPSVLAGYAERMLGEARAIMTKHPWPPPPAS
jgi:hypothetical protein